MRIDFLVVVTILVCAVSSAPRRKRESFSDVMKPRSAHPTQVERDESAAEPSPTDYSMEGPNSRRDDVMRQGTDGSRMERGFLKKLKDAAMRKLRAMWERTKQVARIAVKRAGEVAKAAIMKAVNVLHHDVPRALIYIWYGPNWAAKMKVEVPANDKAAQEEVLRSVAKDLCTKENPCEYEIVPEGQTERFQADSLEEMPSESDALNPDDENFSQADLDNNPALREQESRGSRSVEAVDSDFKRDDFSSVMRPKALSGERRGIIRGLSVYERRAVRV